MQPILIILQITLSYSEFPRNLINSVDVTGDFSGSTLVFQSLSERIKDVCGRTSAGIPDRQMAADVLLSSRN